MLLKDIIEKKLILKQKDIADDPELVKDLQVELQRLKFYRGSIDGIYGRQTDTANDRFCQHRWLNCPQTNQYGSTWASNLKSKNDILVSSYQAEKIFGTKLFERELIDLNSCLQTFEINRPARIRHFLAQVAHESGGLRWLKELADGWDYDPSINPKLARELGNLVKGDGPKYRGAGCLQLTGAYNYRRLSEYVQDPKVMEGCDYVATTYPFTSAGFFWMDAKLNPLCDRGASVREITKIVNGGYNGLADRQYYYNKTLSIIA